MSTVNSIEAVLFSRAQTALTEGELHYLVAESCRAVEIATNAADVARGVAFLVRYDGSPEVHPGAGNFQNASEVPEVLLHFADTFDRVAALTWLLEAARNELLDRSTRDRT